MRRLESYNLVRHVAAVANGFLRMCVDASVENSAFPRRPFRLQVWTWFPMQEHHSRGQRLAAAVKEAFRWLANLTFRRTSLNTLFPRQSIPEGWSQGRRKSFSDMLTIQ